jgi:hypothetical protein
MSPVAQNTHNDLEARLPRWGRKNEGLRTTAEPLERYIWVALIRPTPLRCGRS